LTAIQFRREPRTVVAAQILPLADSLALVGVPIGFGDRVNRRRATIRHLGRFSSAEDMLKRQMT